MKIVLIRPPRRHPMEQSLMVPPLGLAYIASSAKSAGHEVEIWDAYIERWSWEELERRLQGLNVDVIGFSAMTPMWDVVTRAIKIARKSTRWMVVGGPHPTAVKFDIFNGLPELDVGVVGEGEDIFVNLLRWFEHGGELPKGVLHPDHAFRHTEPPNIQTIQRPSRELLNNAHYRYPLIGEQNIGTMITSRGCPFRCSFCDKSVSGSRWRARTAQDVVDEMEEMSTDLGIHFINIYDDNFTLHRHRVLEICKEIQRRGLTLSWKCEGRVDNVDVEMLQAMKDAGCVMIAFGVESGNPKSLELLRKDIQIEQTQKAFQLMRTVGIQSLAYMILGVPGETEEEVWQSIRFTRDIQADYVQFSSLTAMPGTSLAEHFSSQISVRNPLDADLVRPTISTLDEDQLQRLMNQAWRYFYLRPKPLLRLTHSMIRSGYWKEVLKGVADTVLHSEYVTK